MEIAVNVQEDWVERLKAGYDAGYYRTEAASGEQVHFPWQNRSCKDCPFWLNGVCRVHAERRSGMAHTCSYFDEGNRLEGKQLIESRLQQVQRVWWEQFGR